jgi:hypothetical protein
MSTLSDWFRNEGEREKSPHAEEIIAIAKRLREIKARRNWIHAYCQAKTEDAR